MESEARGKWCPFARVGHYSGATFNRGGDGDAEKFAMCLGSACMAWRWSVGDLEVCHRTAGVPPDGEGWTIMELDLSEQVGRLFTKGVSVKWSRPWGDRRLGFCGLAGPRGEERTQ